MAEGEDLRSKGQDKALHEQRKQASETARAAIDSQQKVTQLREAAAAATDPKERERLLQEALEKEVEARSQGKTAQWLQSGGVQGALGGAGVGGAVGTGLGALSGALVGATTSLALGGVGAAVGLGVGALRGPFYQVGSFFKDSKAQPTTLKEQEAFQKATEEVHRSKTPPLEDLETMAGATHNNGAPDQRTPASEASSRPKKKPRKLEVRSGKTNKG